MSKSIGRLYGGYASQDDFNKFIEENYDTSQLPRNGSPKGDLTSQWRKGELKLGEHYYYTTIFSPTIHIQNFTRDVVSFQDFKETVAEVLAPVPSYDEWKAKLEENDNLKKIIGYMIDELVDRKNGASLVDYFSHDLIDEITEALK